MRFQYVSDVHLDIRSSYSLEKTADYLILAGDIGQPCKPNYRAFLESLAAYKQVFLVSGNHEYYSSHRSKHQIDNELYNLCQSLPNVTYLHTSAVDLGPDQPVILGTTLWTHIENKAAAQAVMSDYQKIKIGPQGQRKNKIKPEDTIAWHKQELAWLCGRLSEYSDLQRKIIVVTHHSPSKRSNDAYADQHPNEGRLCDDAYATDLESLFQQYKISVWIHGHTHCVIDQLVGDTRLLCSPVGYPHEALPSNGACFDL